MSFQRNSSSLGFVKIVISVAFLALTSAPISARASVEDDIRELRNEINALQAKLTRIEQAQHAQVGAGTVATTSTPTASPTVTVNDSGLNVMSATKSDVLHVGWVVQLDARQFFGYEGTSNNTFLLRRARLLLDGSINDIFKYQLVPEFGGSSVSIFDASVTAVFDSAFQIKLGKFKSPVGQELLVPEANTVFTDRSLVSNLVPNRDLGVQFSGTIFDNHLTYAFAFVNGVPDGANTTNANYDNQKTGIARLYASPFRGQESILEGLSFGISASTGQEKTASGLTSGYVTPGQEKFFTYVSTAVADGQTKRISPQFDYRNGSFGLFGEYVTSSVTARPSSTGAKSVIKNSAKELTATYLLTGEKSSSTGIVPHERFNPKANTWGGFEVVTRVAQLDIDSNAFPLFASSATNARQATETGFGLNWYLTKAVALKLDYFVTKFSFSSLSALPSTNPILQQDEKALITRFQINF